MSVQTHVCCFHMSPVALHTHADFDFLFSFLSIQLCLTSVYSAHTHTHTHTHRSSVENLFPPVSDYSNLPVRLRKCVTAESGVAKLTLVKNEWKTRRAPKREKSYPHLESGFAAFVGAQDRLSLVCHLLWIIHSLALFSTHTHTH